MANWWDDPSVFDPIPPSELREGCAAARMWHSACSALSIPDPDGAWQQIVDASPPDSVWHSLRNCVAYQAGVWQNLIAKGIDDVLQPAAFKMAIVLRHTPTDAAARMLTELLTPVSHGRDLTSYILALLTDDEASWSCLEEEEDDPELAAAAAMATITSDESEEESDGATVTTLETAVTSTTSTPPLRRCAAPPRDLQLFGDCELAVLAASRLEYDAHAKLVRAEYCKLTYNNYVKLRIKVLKQFTQIPKLYHTTEFECFEAAARENIEREVTTLREHLASGGD